MGWHSIFGTKGRHAVLVMGMACCWLLLNAVAAEGERTDVTGTPAKLQKTKGLIHVSADVLGADGDRQWAPNPQWGVPASAEVAGQLVGDTHRPTDHPAQQPAARFRGTPVWRF